MMVMKVILYAGTTLLLSACATEFTACTWHEVSAADLAIECRNPDPKLMGCQRGVTTCDLYVKKPREI